MLARISAKLLCQSIFVRGFVVAVESNRFVDFRGIRDWRGIEAALESLGPACSAVHINAAFAQTSKLHSRPPDSFLEYLSASVLGKKDSLDYRSAEVIYRACASMRYFNLELLEELDRVVKDQICFVDFASAARMITALGSLRASSKGVRSAEIHIDESLIDSLVSRLKSDSVNRRTSPSDLRRLLHGLADLGAKDETLVVRLEEAIESKLAKRELSGNEVNGLVFGLRRLNSQNHRLATSLLREAAKDHYLSRMSEVQLANLIYNAHNAALSDSSSLEKLFASATEPERLDRYSDRSLCLLLHIADSTHLHKFRSPLLNQFFKNKRLLTCSSKDLVTVLRSLKNGAELDKNRIKTLCLEATKASRLSQFGLSEMVEIISVLAGANNFKDASVMKPLVDELNRPESIKSLSPELLVDLTCSFAALRVSPIRELLGVLQSTMHLLSNSSLLRLASGLSLLTEQTKPLNAVCLRECLKDRRLKHYSASQLLAVFRCAEKMNVNEYTIVERLEREIHDRRDCPDLNGLYSLFYALRQINPKEEHITIDLCGRLFVPEAIEKLSTIQILNLVRSFGDRQRIRSEWRLSALEELAKSKRIHELRSNIGKAIHALWFVGQGGVLWMELLGQVETSDLSDVCLSERISLMLQIAEDRLEFSEERKTISVVNRILDGLLHCSLSGLDVTEIKDLIGSLAKLKYRKESLAVSLSQEFLRRIRQSGMRERELIEVVADLLELNFVMQIKDQTRLIDEINSYLLDVSRPEQKTKSVSRLAASFARLQVLDKGLSHRTWNRCLEFDLRGIESDIYLCFLLMSEAGHQCETIQQVTAAKKAMKSYEQKEARNEEDKFFADEVENLVKASDTIPDFQRGVPLEDVGITVDFAFPEGRSVILLHDPFLDLDTKEECVHGEIVLKYRLLRCNEYKVALVSKKEFYDRPVARRRTWLQGALHSCLSKDIISEINPKAHSVEERC